MSPASPTVVARARHDGPDLEVSLVDLAEPDRRPLATLQVRLPDGHAALIVGLDIEREFDLATAGTAARAELAARLLAACADELRARGRRRVSVTLQPTDGEHLELLLANGYRSLRDADGRRDLVLEL